MYGLQTGKFQDHKGYPLPRLDDIIDSVGKTKFVTKLDLFKGYYQVQLTERAKDISTLITPFGLFQYEVMAFGMTNAPSTFQGLINFIIRDMNGTYGYCSHRRYMGRTFL